MKIVVADDHPIVLNGLCLYLENLKHTILAACINGIEAWNQIYTLVPDIALLDHNMPGLTGIEIAERILREELPVKVILLTMHNERSLLQKAEEVNIKGFLLKDSAVLEIENCINTVSRNKVYYSNEIKNRLKDSRYSSEIEELNKLSPAERKILRYIADQKTTPEIADMLFISDKTVEKHRKNIIQKLNLPPAKNSLLIWAMKHMKSE